MLQQQNEALMDRSLEACPLQQMNNEERLVADYAGTGLTVGKHPMHYRRAELRQQECLIRRGAARAATMAIIVRTAGCVIARQRPGTAKGFIFISMEDETGIANVIVTPDLYERDASWSRAASSCSSKASAKSGRRHPCEGDAALYLVHQGL